MNAGKIFAFIVFGVVIFAVSGEVFKPYEIIPVDTHILEEHLFDAYTFNEEWNTVFLINISEINDHVHKLSQQYYQLVIKCSNKNCNTDRGIDALGAKLKHLEERSKTLSEVAGVKQQRQKRGLFDGIGSLLKLLFGTLDENDKQELDRKINHVFAKSKNNSKLINNETVLLKSGLAKLQTDFQKERALLKFLNKAGNSKQLELHNNALLAVEVTISELKEKIEDLFEGLKLAELDQMSPSIVPPEEFIDALQKLRDNDPSKHMPVSISIANYNFYRRVSTVNIVKHEGNLFYIVHTPIPTSLPYTVKKLTPLPIQYNGKYFVYDNLPKKPIAI